MLKKTSFFLLTIAIFIIPAVQAAYPTSISRTYYKTAAMQIIVGYYTLGCNVNSGTQVGEKTPYYKNEELVIQCY